MSTVPPVIVSKEQLDEMKELQLSGSQALNIWNILKKVWKSSQFQDIIEIDGLADFQSAFINVGQYIDRCKTVIENQKPKSRQNL